MTRGVRISKSRKEALRSRKRPTSSVGPGPVKPNIYRKEFGQVHPDGRDLGSGQVAGTAGAWARGLASKNNENPREPYPHWTKEGYGKLQNVEQPSALTTTQAHTQITKSSKFTGINQMGKNTFRDPMSPHYKADKGTKQNKKNKKMPWESF